MLGRAAKREVLQLFALALVRPLTIHHIFRASPHVDLDLDVDLDVVVDADVVAVVHLDEPTV